MFSCILFYYAQLKHAVGGGAVVEVLVVIVLLVLITLSTGLCGLYTKKTILTWPGSLIK